MRSPDNSTGADYIDTLFNELSKKLQGLPTEQRGSIEACFEKLQYSVSSLFQKPQQINNLGLDHGLPNTALQLLLDQITDAVLIYQVVRNDAGEIIDWYYREANSCLFSLLGVSREALIGKSATEVYSADFIHRLLPMVKQVLLTGKQSDYEYNNNGKLYSISMFRIDDHTVADIAREITQQREVENHLHQIKETLNESETRYRDLAESINDGFFELDREWRCAFANQRAASIVGRTPSDLIGINVWEEFPGLRGTSAERYYRDVMETRKPASFEMPGIYTGKWFLIRVYPSNKGIAIFWIDITWQKQAAEELRKKTEALRLSEEKFSLAFMNSPVAIAISTKTDARFIDVNDNYCQIFGFKREELIGHTSFELGIFPDPEARKEFGDQFATGRLFRNMEFRLRAKSGEPRDVIFSTEFITVDRQTCVLTTVVDITERKRVEEQLRVQATIFEILYEPIIISDLQTTITYWNAAAERTFGFKAAEVIGKTTRDVLHTEISDEERAAAIRGLQEGKPAVTELVQHTKDNRTLVIAGYTVPLRDTLGNIIGYVAANWDITERKIADAALKKANLELIEERNRLLAVMEALPIGISILDQHGGLIQNNKAFDAVWCGPLPPTESIKDFELYKAWWVETGQPVQPEEWAASLAVQRGETVTGQFLQIQRFDGSQAYVLNSAAPIRNAEGEITGSAVAIMDINQWIEAEHALRESEQRFRVAVNSAPILVYECDRDLRYTWIYNPFRGFRAEDVIGKRDDEVLSPEAAEQLIAAKQLAIETGQGRMQEVKVPMNGEDTYYILTIDPIRDTNGKVIGLTCSAIDITEQKWKDLERQEQAIHIEVQRRLMDQRERDRYSLSRDIHDGPIQTLSSTMFQLQMIKEVISDPLLKNDLDQVGMYIRNSIRELRDVMNDLRPPALIHFGFSKVVSMYIEDFRTRFPQIELYADLDKDDHILADATHLTLFRIFQSGINNIIRHSEANKVWVVYRIDKDSFSLELRDNGRGFEHDQNFSLLTRNGHFGLVGMKERAEAIGGEFTVTSEPGKGTTILVKGPLSRTNVK